MLRGVVYSATALCFYNKEMVLRRYIGMFKVRCVRSEMARLRREKKHKEQPVKWFSAMDPSTFKMEIVSRQMDVQMALVEEAILSARALIDKGAPCRGGPFACCQLYGPLIEVAAAVRRHADQASTPFAARQAVLRYALSLEDDNALKKHVLNRYYSDSAERRMGPPRDCRSCDSGNGKRQKRGLEPGTQAYIEHKWGSDIEANRREDNRRQKQRRRG